MDILNKIELNYLERCNNIDLQKSTWRDISKILVPAQNLTESPRPSFKIVSKSGDLGLSMLWIVQSTLVHSFITDILKDIDENSKIYSILSSLDKSLIGSFAHSEDKDNRLIISEKNKHYVLNGLKKYITGGTASDFLIITGRKNSDEKITKLFYIPASSIQKHGFKELNLNSLNTTSHASLKLDNFKIDEHNIIPIDPSIIRRTLKRWSIIERSLIMESVIGLCSYLNMKIYEINEEWLIDSDNLNELIHSQQSIVDEQILSAYNKEKINEKSADFKLLFETLTKFKSYYDTNKDSLPDEILLRLKDLSFLSKLR